MESGLRKHSLAGHPSPYWRPRGGTGAGPHTSPPLKRRSSKNSGSSGGSILPTGATPVPGGTPPRSLTPNL